MKTLISETFNTKLPVMQAPMALAVTPEFTAKVSYHGAIGGFGAHCMKPEEIHKAVTSIKNTTEKPFNINIFAPPHIKSHIFAGPLEAQERFQSQINYFTEFPVPILSFHFGLPSEQDQKKLKEVGTTLVSSATSVSEALYLENQNIDIIVLQGKEAGGHHNRFMPNNEDYTPLEILLKKTLEIVSTPIVAAGGISTAKDALKYINLGASGVQMGTAFLACEESSIRPVYRKALLSANANGTYITSKLTGRPARAIKNSSNDHFWCGEGIEKVSHKNIKNLTNELKKILTKGE